MTNKEIFKSTTYNSLDEQVGGKHYRNMKIQPAEFINENKLLFAEGNAIKYICRHSVKGMEADLVIVDSNWGPNSIKSYNSGDRKKEDEETRVAYVGTSRAKKHLIIYEHSMKVKNRFPLLTHEFLEQ